MDSKRIPVSGDPFYAAALVEKDPHHACNDGWVTIGQMVLGEETGEEVEEYALYLCRRCLGNSQ